MLSQTKMKIGIAGPILTSSLLDYLDVGLVDMPKGLGGTAVNNLIKGLLNKEYKISVYTLSPDVKDKVVLKGKNLTIFYGKYRKSGKLRMIDFFNKEWSQIKEFINNDKPDFVHAHWSYEFAAGTLKSNLPHLITVRDAPLKILALNKEIYRLVRLLLHLWVIKKGENFTIVSPYLKNKIFIGDKNLTVIPNFISDEIFPGKPKSNLNKPAKIVSVLNGWGKIKNPVPALEAFKKLQEDYNGELQYHIYGPGYEPDGKAAEWALKNKCNFGVKFCGPVAHNELLKVLPSFDIMLHPSKEESFGNTLIEAMYSGFPVIGGNNSGAVPWVLNYGRNGMLTDVSSSEEIYITVKNLIEDKELYKKLSCDGINYVKENFSSNAVIEKYISLYTEILNGNGFSLKPTKWN